MTDKTYENIKIEREGHVTFLVLNRPEKRNAMSPGLHYDVQDALKWLDDDAQTRVLVLTGAGDAWCAGQDLKLYFRETANKPMERKKSNNASHNWRWELLTRFTKPTIAMVNGFCFGGAFTQLCACDFAITAEDATFGLSEVNWGILPGGIVSWNLTDLICPGTPCITPPPASPSTASARWRSGSPISPCRAISCGPRPSNSPTSSRSSIPPSCATPRKPCAPCAT